MKYAGYVVAIVGDPRFGDHVAELLERMPVWMADTEANHAAAARAPTARKQSQTVNHTAIGALTTLRSTQIQRLSPGASDSRYSRRPSRP
jgi:hypothetical protein